MQLQRRQPCSLRLQPGSSLGLVWEAMGAEPEWSDEGAALDGGLGAEGAAEAGLADGVGAGGRLAGHPTHRHHSALQSSCLCLPASGFSWKPCVMRDPNGAKLHFSHHSVACLHHWTGRDVSQTDRDSAKRVSRSKQPEIYPGQPTPPHTPALQRPSDGSHKKDPPLAFFPPSRPSQLTSYEAYFCPFGMPRTCAFSGCAWAVLYAGEGPFLPHPLMPFVPILDVPLIISHKKWLKARWMG